jgi:hypothetical protein
VHLRRFNLRKSALEIFLVDQTNSFLNFPTFKKRNRIFLKIFSLRPPNLVFQGTRSPKARNLLNLSQFISILVGFITVFLGSSCRNLTGVALLLLSGTSRVNCTKFPPVCLAKIVSDPDPNPELFATMFWFQIRLWNFFY